MKQRANQPKMPAIREGAGGGTSFGPASTAGGDGAIMASGTALEAVPTGYVDMGNGWVTN